MTFYKVFSSWSSSMMHFSLPITSSTLVPLKYVCGNHKSNLKTCETIFRKIYSLLYTPSFNNDLIAQRERSGLLTWKSRVQIPSGEDFFFNYFFLKIVSLFKLDLWIPQKYFRGTKVLDVIGRQKYIIGG